MKNHLRLWKGGNSKYGNRLKRRGVKEEEKEKRKISWGKERKKMGKNDREANEENMGGVQIKRRREGKWGGERQGWTNEKETGVGKQERERPGWGWGKTRKRETGVQGQMRKERLQWGGEQTRRERDRGGCKREREGPWSANKKERDREGARETGEGVQTRKRGTGGVQTRKRGIKKSGWEKEKRNEAKRKRSKEGVILGFFTGRGRGSAWFYFNGVPKIMRHIRKLWEWGWGQGRPYPVLIIIVSIEQLQDEKHAHTESNHWISSLHENVISHTFKILYHSKPAWRQIDIIIH